MKNKIEKTIEALLDKSTDTTSAISTQQYSQAVLNLTNALIGLEQHNK